jgi:glycosyltransferase involved in cell wall biosynthesis
MALVSVIIPVYNSEEYIAEAVESVLGQSYGNFEIVIIDDGSTDNTLSILEPYRVAPHFRIIRQANAGPSSARNQGIRYSQGKYCAFLDADDIMMPERLKLQVDAMEEQKDIGLVYTDLMTFNKEGIIHRTKKAFTNPYSGNVLDKLLVENFITTSTVMVRKSCFDEVPLFDESISHSEDYKMWLNIAERFKLGYVDLPLVKYRYHANSLSCDRVVIGKSSYRVVQEFWEQHEYYRREHKILYRISMSNQLTHLGNAYFNHREYHEAFGHIAKAFKFYPFLKQTYKILIKLLVHSKLRYASIMV